MKQQRSFLMMLVLLISQALIFTACTPEDPDEGEEEITTVRLVFANGPTVTWEEGATANPEITLDANTTYTVKAEFLDETDPADVEDITAEILEEDDEHLVCYEVTGGATATITRTDSDGNFEVGLNTEWVTGEASTGSVMLELRHQPGVKDGTCTPGDSDVAVTFNLTVQ